MSADYVVREVAGRCSRCNETGVGEDAGRVQGRVYEMDGPTRAGSQVVICTKCLRASALRVARA